MWSNTPMGAVLTYGHLLKLNRLPWCHGFSVSLCPGAFGRVFHTGLAAISGPRSCSRAFNSFSDWNKARNFWKMANTCVKRMKKMPLVTISYRNTSSSVCNTNHKMKYDLGIVKEGWARQYIYGRFGEKCGRIFSIECSTVVCLDTSVLIGLSV